MPDIEDLFDFNTQFFDETEGLRGDLIGALQNDISNINSPITMQDVSRSPLFPVLQQSASDRFKQARDDILTYLPQGGVAQRGIGDALINRAKALTEGQAGIAENIQNQRLGSLNIGANVATAPLSLAGTQASLAALQAAREDAKNESIGGAIDELVSK